MRELTGRPLQVVQMAAEGLGVKEMAQQMGLSAETVKDYRVRALDLLGANNMAHAVAIAARRGYLPGVRVVEAA